MVIEDEFSHLPTPQARWRARAARDGRLQKKPLTEEQRERKRATTKRFYTKHKERLTKEVRHYQTNKKFGLSLEEYQVARSKPCEICGSKENLVLDHDHLNGKPHYVGTLCNLCNLAIGHMGDNPERLRAAADYVERTR